MIRILLDTNAYTAFKRGNADAVETLRRVDQIGISVIVMGELLAGFAAGSHEIRNRFELDAFLNSPRVNIIPVDQETTRHYANIYKQLRQKGRPIPDNDMWIAATALQHCCAVYTYDKHFSQIDGLPVASKLADIFP